MGSFLATLSPQMLSSIVLDTGRISVDVLNNSIVHFKKLRSLELKDAVFMSDFVLWKVLGTLPYLANFTFVAFDPESHPADAPENSNSQSGGPKYFEALESLLGKRLLPPYPTSPRFHRLSMLKINRCQFSYR